MHQLQTSIINCNLMGGGCRQGEEVPINHNANKEEVVKKIKREEVSNSACSYGMIHFTIGTITKTKDKIMEHVKSSVSMQFMIMSKKRGKVMENMEIMLSIWIKDQHQQYVLSLLLTQENSEFVL